MNVTEVWCESVNWMKPAPSGVQHQDFMKTVMNFGLRESRKFLVQLNKYYISGRQFI
jgi:hypothetical protein